MTSSGGPVLVLWDIDRTLITVGGISLRIYEEAFLEIAGQPVRKRTDMAGRTERAILQETLRLNGMPAEDELLPEYFDAIARAADSLRDEMRRAGYALPGAAAAIRTLSGAGAIQSVVTGNLKQVSITKLSVFGLDGDLDFEVGGYGDESEDRALLVKQAVWRANQSYGYDFSGDRTVVIGDTIHDIRGAQDCGVRSIGVASGTTPASGLSNAGATAVLADLTDTAALLDVVLRTGPKRPFMP